MIEEKCDQCGKSPIKYGWKEYIFCSDTCTINFRERIEKGNAE